MAPDDLVLGDATPSSRTSLGAPSLAGPPVPGLRDSVPSISPGAQALGLAPERSELLAMGLPQSVVSTIQGARAPSTQVAYAYRWGVFQSWCNVRQVDPLSCTAPDILCFLQDMLEVGKSPSTMRGMVAAIKAARGGGHKLSERCGDLIARFLKGARRVTPYHRRPAVPPWDLEVVLATLQEGPFEPLDRVNLKWLSLKTAFLLAIVSAKRMGELHALSVHEECCRFLPGDAGVVLRPNPAFHPKVWSNSRANQFIELHPLHPGRGTSHCCVL